MDDEIHQPIFLSFGPGREKNAGEESRPDLPDDAKGTRFFPKWIARLACRQRQQGRQGQGLLELFSGLGFQGMGGDGAARAGGAGGPRDRERYQEKGKLGKTRERRRGGAAGREAKKMTERRAEGSPVAPAPSSRTTSRARAQRRRPPPAPLAWAP